MNRQEIIRKRFEEIRNNYFVYERVSSDYNSNYKDFFLEGKLHYRVTHLYVLVTVFFADAFGHCLWFALEEATLETYSGANAFMDCFCGRFLFWHFPKFLAFRHFGFLAFRLLSWVLYLCLPNELNCLSVSLYLDLPCLPIL